MIQILNEIKDIFTSADFNVESSMKVNDLCKKFKENFGLALRVYKGKQIASDGRMTLKSLDERTTKTSVNFDSETLKLRANMLVSEVEKKFLDHFGIVVKVADIENKKIISSNITLGNAKRQSI
ncbi:hypothetical protein [Capnocytophaga sp. oral taxon 878]|uniref:hypothetical protein n=1 Tax=Capnocytophaga sp. oral taxon 878 TaxID=1316596 RepID=UPI000D023682|nr:hypothetical protein [Capnocytophaga sp. oral taxon 878]AVM50794.1 hypothetical protein C4H12_10160 [Capnocytophaga sp. oral taxon 878]